MKLSRRMLVSGMLASAAPAWGKDTRPCDPPRYERWTAKRERRWADRIDAGFVNYYGEPYRFDGEIQVPRDTLPTCAVFGATASSLSDGRLRDHLADLEIRGHPASTDCALWPSESTADFDQKVAALLRALEAECPDPAATEVRFCPVGSHHSSSDVYLRADDTRTVMVRVDGLNHLVLNRPEWKPSFVLGSSSSAFALVGGGILVCHLNEALWERGLALETQGSFDGQSLAGAISTGTHGAGAFHGAIADSVEAVVLVTALRDPATGAGRWEVLQIEPDPDEAISDPARFPADRAGVRWRLVQDRALFEAVIVSMGTMGVIAGFVMRTRPAYFLYEVRVGRPWTEVRSNFTERALVPPNGFSDTGWRYELVVNPEKVAGHDEWVCCEVYRSAWEYDLDYLSETREIPQKWVGGLTRTVNLGGQLGIYVSRVAGRSLTRGDRVGTFADRAYAVLKLGQGEFVQAWGAELMVPARRAGDLVDWVLRTNVERGKLGFGTRRGERLLNPFGVRFARGRRGYLSPVRWFEDGEPGIVCTAELTEPVKNSEARNSGVRANGKPSSKAILETWAEDFVRTFGSEGRLHWGQVQGGYGPKDLERSYPVEEIDRFVDAFRTLNPFGLFDTTFARRLGFVARREGAAGPPPPYRGL